MENKYEMLDGELLRKHGVQSTLKQICETSRTMLIVVFNDFENINTIRFYKGVLYRLRKGYVEDGL